MTDRYDVVVIGGGIAGSAAALRAAQNHMRVAWLVGTKQTAKRSRSQWVANVDNMIGMHDGIIRKKVLKALRGKEHAAAREVIEDAHHMHISTRDIVANTRERLETVFAEQIDIINAAAESATAVEGGGFSITSSEGTIASDAVVLATGVMDRQPSIKKTKGDDVIDAPRWVYPFANRETVLYCIRCEGHLTADSKVAVIGHGEAAGYLAMMLHERYGSACAVLTNGEAPTWGEKVERVLAAYGVAVRQERLVDMGGKKGKLNAITLEGGDEVLVQFALVSLGLHRVYNELAIELGAALQDTDEPVGERHVLIDARGETSVQGVFAVGDMARRPDEGVMKQIYTSQEYAVRAVDAIDGRRRAKKRAAALEAAAG